MEPILHITSARAWIRASETGEYHGDTLASAGFIHASTLTQALAVANARYRDLPEPLLLVIDPRRLSAPMRYEAGENGQLYPHIYGALNLDAVVQVESLRKASDGRYLLPRITRLLDLPEADATPT